MPAHKTRAPRGTKGLPRTLTIDVDCYAQRQYERSKKGWQHSWACLTEQERERYIDQAYNELRRLTW